MGSILSLAMQLSSENYIRIIYRQLCLTGIALCSYCFFYYIAGNSKGLNPFLKDTRREQKPYESNKKRRDEILRCAYSTKSIESALDSTGGFDAIIIGSGIGGLMCGALLARAGKKVLVLEQHDQAGGCCHSFTEKGFEFDTGIHYVGEMRNNTSVKFLFDQVSNGQLRWSNVRDDFDTVVIVDGNESKKADDCIKSGTPIKTTQISFMSTEEDTIKSLLTAFPQEEVAIKKYFKLLKDFRQSLLWFVSLKLYPSWIGHILAKTGIIYLLTDYFTYSSKSVSQAISELTQNKLLRAVLAYNFGDYGTVPKEAPFSMHAALQNHFLKGVSYPTGGSSEIAYNIIPTILKSNGRVFVRADVESIITNETGTKATGVKMHKDGRIISAPIIISDAGLMNTVHSLLPPICASNFESALSHVRHGNGGMSVYVGLRGTAEELGISGKHYWAIWDNATGQPVTSESDIDLDRLIETYMNTNNVNEFVDPRSQNKVPMLFISFPSAKDPLWSTKHPNKSTATIVTFANYKWFKRWENNRVNHRGSDYEAIKKRFGEMIWNQTLSLFPQLKDKVLYITSLCFCKLVYYSLIG
jgi:all-trans-retinol 13,14-reductase